MANGLPPRLRDNVHAVQKRSAQPICVMSEEHVTKLPELHGESGHSSESVLADERSTRSSSTCSDDSHACQADVPVATITAGNTRHGTASERKLRGQKAEAVPRRYPLVEETKRTVLLSSDPTKATDGPSSPVHTSRLAKSNPAAEFAERTPSKRRSRDVMRAFRARSVPCGPCSRRFRSLSARRKRQHRESQSTASCCTRSPTDVFSSGNESESIESISTERHTVRYLLRTSSTPLETSLGIEEKCESIREDLRSRGNVRGASESSPASTHAESTVDAASLSAGFRDELSAQLLDIDDLLESTSARQCAGGTKDHSTWPSLALGDQQSRTESLELGAQQSRTEAQGETDMDERVAAWDPSQEDSYALSAPGELELLELELFDPRRPPTPSPVESKLSSDHEPAGNGTRSNLHRFKRAPSAVSPDTSLYEDLEWITEVSGKHSSGWATSVGDIAADRTSTGLLPTVDTEARQPAATQGGRAAPSCAGGAPGAEKSTARTLLAQNTETPSFTSGTFTEQLPWTGWECEDALTELSNSISLGTPEMTEVSESHCETFALEEGVSCDSAGPESGRDDSRGGSHCTDNSRAPRSVSRLQVIAVLDGAVKNDSIEDRKAGSAKAQPAAVEANLRRGRGRRLEDALALTEKDGLLDEASQLPKANSVSGRSSLVPEYKVPME